MEFPGRDSSAGLVLAAGAGHRFGQPKALVRYRGRLFVEAAAEVLRTAGCDPVVVVLGAAAERVRERADLDWAVLVDNPDWATGMGSSLRVGITALVNGPSQAVLVLPVDLPGVTAEAVRRVAAHSAPDALAAAEYDGARGHPVLLGRAHWAGVLLAAQGDTGAREYLRGYRAVAVPCGDIADGRDVDRPEDLPD